MYKKIPMRNLLKGRFLKIAELQDKIIIDLVRNFEIIFHGGTVIWRVYGGKRFSYDIDLYYRNPKEIHKYLASQKLFEIILNRVTSSGVVYSKLGEGNVIVEVDISPVFKEIRTKNREFVLTDGSSIVVNTLSPETMLAEKIATYVNRGKVKDLYDIYHLLDLAENLGNLRKDLRKLLEKLKSPSKDFKGLNELILVGKPPTFEMIASKVKRYAKG